MGLPEDSQGGTIVSMSEAEQADLPEHLACPTCRGEVSRTNDALVCEACGGSFGFVHGIPDLLVGEYFDDEPDEAMWENENQTGTFLAKRYLEPLFRELSVNDSGRPARVLSIGCGVGSEVEVLTQSGYDAYGIDAGSRTEWWARREYPSRYYRASATRLPFKDNSFDFLVMGCVLPHIGVVGDTWTTTPDCHAERELAVREAVRVTRKSGYLLISGPNRRFPIDFFHRNSRTSHRPRLHSPNEEFLLSFGDYRNLLVDRAGCQSLDALPIKNYWGFFSSSRHLLGRLMQIPVRVYFDLISRGSLQPLLRSALNPWLVVLARK